MNVLLHVPPLFVLYCSAAPASLVTLRAALLVMVSVVRPLLTSKLTTGAAADVSVVTT